MARAGTASWIATAPSRPPTPPHRQSESNPGAKTTAAGRRNGRQTPSNQAQPPQAKARGAALHSAKQPGGTDQPARKIGPIGAGSDRSPTTRRANPANPANPANRTNHTRPAAAPPPPSGSTRGEGPTPNAGATPPTPGRRSSSPPPPPMASPSARKPATGGSAPVDKPERALGKRPARRWRANLKRGGR
jgi:hypothetical protein